MMKSGWSVVSYQLFTKMSESLSKVRTAFPQFSSEIWEKIEAMAALHREWNAKINLVSRNIFNTLSS